MIQQASVARICVVGSTGLVGRAILEAAAKRDDIRPVGIARQEVPLPAGARMEMLLADPSGWPQAIAAANAQVLVCALGTTMRQVGGDKDAFRAVDLDLVLESARAALDAGIDHMIVVSSVGAETGSGNFYLRTKGEMETALRKLGFRRLDILRPSLLLGKRRESRPLERLAILAAPLLSAVLLGKYRRYRPIRASTVAQAILSLVRTKAAGKFVHEFDAMHYAIRRADDFSGHNPAR